MGSNLKVFTLLCFYISVLCTSVSPLETNRWSCIQTLFIPKLLGKCLMLNFIPSLRGRVLLKNFSFQNAICAGYLICHLGCYYVRVLLQFSLIFVWSFWLVSWYSIEKYIATQIGNLDLFENTNQLWASVVITAHIFSLWAKPFAQH